jgi:SAM-dependent methyltransferase
LQNSWWEAIHQFSKASDSEKKAAVQEYEQLKSIVRQFLGAEIERDKDGRALIFGLLLGSSKLSDGQKIILQLCIAIHSQKAHLNDLILFLDEPENHLHPSALLEFVTQIRDCLPNGQLWVSTHSIHLLSSAPVSSIWWMEKGRIKRVGKTPEVVLGGLLGNGKHRNQLADFLDLPFVLAANRFAVQCMFRPDVVGFRGADKQVSQIIDIIQPKLLDSEPLRILDFGAGKGRLAAEIAELLPDAAKKVSYFAYDKLADHSTECRTSIESLHTDDVKRYFNDLSELNGQEGANSFDFVILCNVLHEIPPSEWNGLFGLAGKIADSLKVAGNLLLVEVQQLPYGERAHKHGFIVLNSAQLRKLFSVPTGETSGFLENSQSDGWLKAHLISSVFVNQYTPETRRAALRDLVEMSKDKIEELRSSTATDYETGRKHGFWVHQYANANLAICGL